MIDLKKINKLSKSEFLSIFGNVFEKSKWIAERLYETRPFNSLETLVLEMIKIYENSDDKTIIKIFNLHPELAIEKKLTKDSENEQSKANLKECTIEEFEDFKNLNLIYKNKFKFPFIIAVKDKTKIEILNTFKKRIENSFEVEFKNAKDEVRKIATFRLKELIN